MRLGLTNQSHICCSPNNIQGRHHHFGDVKRKNNVDIRLELNVCVAISAKLDLIIISSMLVSMSLIFNQGH